MDINPDTSLGKLEDLRIKKRYGPTMRELCHTTHFNFTELESLVIIYYKATRRSPMNRKRFKELIHAGLDITDDSMTDRMFYIFCVKSRVDMCFEDFAAGLSTIIRGTFEERIKFCYKVYDLMDSHFITRNIMFQLMKNSLVSAGGEDMGEEDVKDMVDLIIHKMDLDRDGKVSMEDFRQTVLKQPLLIECFGTCLPARETAKAFLTTFTPTFGLQDNSIIVTF